MKPARDVVLTSNGPGVDPSVDFLKEFTDLLLLLRFSASSKAIRAPTSALFFIRLISESMIGK